jgi:hypothetical protein
VSVLSLLYVAFMEFACGSDAGCGNWVRSFGEDGNESGSLTLTVSTFVHMDGMLLDVGTVTTMIQLAC